MSLGPFVGFLVDTKNKNQFLLRLTCRTLEPRLPIKCFHAIEHFGLVGPLLPINLRPPLVDQPKSGDWKARDVEFHSKAEAVLLRQVRTHIAVSAANPLRTLIGLLFQQAGVAGYTLPAAFGEDPGIGETADMFVWLALVSSFGVVNANHYGGIGVHAHLEVLDV